MWILPNSLKCSLIKECSDFSIIAQNSLLVRSKVLNEKAWVTKCKRDAFCEFIRKRYFGQLFLKLNVKSALHKSTKIEATRFIQFEEHHWKAWLISQKKFCFYRWSRKTLPRINPNESQDDNNMWRTPTLMEVNRGAYKTLSKLYAVEQGHQVSLTAQVQEKSSIINEHRQNITIAGQLNPRWIECLMGIPIGWVKPYFRKRVHT